MPERGRRKEEERVYQIGEVAEMTGLTHRTLRYYEERGLLGERHHPAGQHRHYTDADIDRLGRIQKFKEAIGFSLCEIKEFLDMDEERGALLEEAEATGNPRTKSEKLNRALAIFKTELQAAKEQQSRIEDVERLLDDRIKGIESELRRLKQMNDKPGGKRGK